VDYIVTGAVDDLMKVWIFKSYRLELNTNFRTIG